MAFTDGVAAAAIDADISNAGRSGAGSNITLGFNGGEDLVGGSTAGAEVRGYVRYAIEGEPPANGSTEEERALKAKFDKLLETRFAYQGRVNGDTIEDVKWIGVAGDAPAMELEKSWPPVPQDDNANTHITHLILIATNEPTAVDLALFEGNVGRSLTPTAGGDKDLGEEAKRFRHGYFSGDLKGGAISGATAATTGKMTAGGGIAVPKVAGGNAQIGGADADIIIPETGIDTAIAAAQTQAQIDAGDTDPNEKRLVSAKAMRMLYDDLLAQFTSRPVSRYEEEAPAVPGADNIWPTPGAFLGQRWIHGNDEYVWLRTGGTDEDAEANKFPAVRWAQTKGAVRIFRAGTSTAGELDDISTSHKYQYVASANADRAWEWTDFRRFDFYTQAIPRTAKNQDQSSPISSTATAFIAGEKVITAEENKTITIARAGASAFSQSGSSVPNEIEVVRIYAEF